LFKTKPKSITIYKYALIQ